MTPLLRTFSPLIRYTAVCCVLCALGRSALPEAEQRGFSAACLMVAVVCAGAVVVLWRSGAPFEFTAPDDDDGGAA